MRRRRFGGVFVLLILFVFGPAVRAGFEIRNRQLFLEDEPFAIRGVVYSNTPIGARGSDGPGPAGCLYARDFPLIAGMGANTVRTQAIISPEDGAFRGSLADADLYWLAGFPLDRFYPLLTFCLAVLLLAAGSPPLQAQDSTPRDQIYYFPHLAVGASWQTTITYINYSPEEVTCQTDFISDHGSPLMVSFAELGMVDSRTDVLPPGGSVHQETDVDLSAPLAPGWARATCSGPVQASLLFRQYDSEGMPVAEAGVNAATVPATRFVTFAEQGEGKNGTGVAYAKPFRHSGSGYLYCPGRGWGGAGYRRSDVAAQLA